MIALSVWATSEYFKYKIEREKEKDKQALEFLAERMKKRSALLDELNGHVHNFDHYVNHVHEGDKGWYETAIDEKFKIIRALSRDKIEVIGDDFPEFLEFIYSFTDEGKSILTQTFNFKRYEASKKALLLLFAHVRATLPGMRKDTL
jgi:vacuolar-type H+-ATPase subunit I/STV1